MIKQTRTILNSDRADLLRSVKRLAAGLLAAAVLAGCTIVPTAPEPASPPQPVAKRPPRVGLALGGGAARGFAHVGVIKALEEAGISADIVAGSSSGAIIAAIYAAGHDARSLEALAVGVERDTLIDFRLFGNGWVEGEALQDFVNEAVGSRPIEALARPFVVTATRARDGAQVIFNRGDTGLAVRASASVPRLIVSATPNPAASAVRHGSRPMKPGTT